MEKRNGGIEGGNKENVEEFRMLNRVHQVWSDGGSRKEGKGVRGIEKDVIRKE